MKYECPKCQSQLKYWEEFVVTKHKTINKSNGAFNIKIERSIEIPMDTQGIVCTNKNCDFEYNGDSRFRTGEDQNEKMDDVFEQTIGKEIF